MTDASKAITARELAERIGKLFVEQGFPFLEGCEKIMEIESLLKGALEEADKQGAIRCALSCVAAKEERERTAKLAEDISPCGCFDSAVCETCAFRRDVGMEIAAQIRGGR